MEFRDGAFHGYMEKMVGLCLPGSHSVQEHYDPLCSQGSFTGRGPPNARGLYVKELCSSVLYDRWTH